MPLGGAGEIAGGSGSSGSGGGGSGISDITSTGSTPATVTVTAPTGPTTNVEVPTGGATGYRRRNVIATAGPGGTPAIATGTANQYQDTVVNLTAIAATITNMSTSLTGSPQEGDTLRISFTSASGSHTITTWGASFSGDALPTTITTTRLDTSFYWNTASGTWLLVGVTTPTVVYQDLGSTSVTLTNTPATVFNPSLGIGVWSISVVLLITAEGSISTPCAAFIQPTGSGATFTLPSTSGNPIGSRYITPTGTAVENAVPMSFTAVATVTAAGTVLIQAGVAAGGSGSPIVKAQDTTTFSGLTIQLSSVTCIQIG